MSYGHYMSCLHYHHLSNPKYFFHSFNLLFEIITDSKEPTDEEVTRVALSVTSLVTCGPGRAREELLEDE